MEAVTDYFLEACIAQVYNSLTWKPKLEEFVAHDAEVRSLSIGKKSSRVFITGGSDRKVNLWAIGKQTPLLVCAPITVMDTSTGYVEFDSCCVSGLLFVQSLSGHTGSVEAVEFDTAEVLVLAGSSNGSIKLWDLEEAKGVVSVLKSALGTV